MRKNQSYKPILLEENPILSRTRPLPLNHPTWWATHLAWVLEDYEISYVHPLLLIRLKRGYGFAFVQSEAKWLACLVNQSDCEMVHV